MEGPAPDWSHSLPKRSVLSAQMFCEQQRNDSIKKSKTPMYQIDKKPYGLHLTFSGHIPKDELEQWLTESKEMISSLPDEFVVLIDMRELELLAPESRPAMVEGQEYYRVHGMQRSVVILKDKVTMLQFQGIAKETGIYEWERYIDATAEPNWEEIGLDWILNAVDPDNSREKIVSISREPA